MHVKPFKCYTLCSRTFYSQADLQQHEAQHAAGKIRNVSIKLRTFECFVCKRAMRSRNSTMVHLRRHSARITFECLICFKQYLKKACLQRHLLRKHMGEQPDMYECEICFKKFGERSYLIKHMDRHSVRGPHWCSKCSLRFKSKDTLYFHNQKHVKKSDQLDLPRKQPLYKCSFCNFSASLEETFISHMQNHGLSLKCFVKMNKIPLQNDHSV